MAQLFARAALCCALSCSLALGSVPPAAAQSKEDVAAARTLAGEGAKLFSAGDYAAAIDRFTRAETLVHAPPHVLYLARANAKLGKLVVAREHYLHITKESLDPKAPKAFVEAQKSAKDELAALEPRIASLEITLKGVPSGQKVEVTVDGQAVPAALIGVHRPIDPGTHKIEAKGDKLAGEASVTLGEGAKESVAVEVKPTADATPAPPPPEPPAPPPEAPPSSGGTTKIIGYTALGIGVVGLAAGTFFLLQSSSKRSDADALCPNSQCPESKKSEIDALDADANRARTFAFVGFGVGAVGVGTGIALLVMSSGSSEAPKKTSGVTVRPFATFNGFGLTGSF